jgi:hypothetical protein
MLKTSLSIADLQTQVATHEATILANTGVISGHVATIAARDATILEHTGTIAGHVATIAERDATILEHTGTIAGHVATIAERDAKIIEINGKIVAVDTAADVKARELAARNGVVTPPKAPGAGDATIEPVAVTGTPRSRLAAFFTVKA